MTKLDIVAEVAAGVAAPGVSGYIIIVVCVTNTDGSAVSGLTKSRFKVRAVVVNGVNIDPSIKEFSEQTTAAFAGYYVLMMATVNDEHWRAGDYVFAVAVETPMRGGATAQGRTLASLHMPAL